MAESRNKGARYERHIADRFRQAGFDTAFRSAQYCGNTGDAPDVAGLPYIHVECKCYKDTAWMNKWMDQAVRDAKDGCLPVVIHKVNYGNDTATLRATDAFEMLSEYYVGFSEAEMRKLQGILRHSRKFSSMDGLALYDALHDVVFIENAAEYLVDFGLDDFMEIYIEYQNSRYLEDSNVKK